MQNRFFFTFGSDHLGGEGRLKYVEIAGDVTYEQARGIMFAMFGAHWAFPYTEEEFNHVRHPYTRHMLITVVNEDELPEDYWNPKVDMPV